MIRGDTFHHEEIANEISRGIGQSAQGICIPLAFGVLTCNTFEQAIDRGALETGNKGFEPRMGAIEMVPFREALVQKA